MDLGAAGTPRVRLGLRSPQVNGEFWGVKGPAQDMPGHGYGADADWGVLDGVHIGATWRIR